MKTNTLHATKSSPSPFLSPINISIQRSPSCPCDGGCPRCRGVIQPKLVIDQPWDIYEQEADKVAELVMRMPNPASVPQSPVNSRQEGLSQSTGSYPEKNIQRSQPTIPPIVNDVLSSPGRPLDPATRAYMEPKFGHDFSQVRVYSGAAAEQSARDMNAHAYTVGRNIVFGAGRFAPETYEGRRLIAHELTHVVQQARSLVPHVQRDKGDTPKTAPREAQKEAPEHKEALAQVSAIERNWARVKGIAGGFAETKGWIAKGDAVVALIREHTTRSLDAIAAHDLELVNDYKILLEGDLVAYRYVIWHTFVYQNLARLRPEVDSLVSSFDADKTHFTGRTETEDAVRQLKRLIDGLGTDSARNLSALITDHPIKVRAGRANEVSITVTSAADKAKRAALEKETHEIINVQLAVQVVLKHTNQFLRNATREGFWNAIEAVKEYIEVRNAIIDTDGGPDVNDSQKPGESKESEGKSEKKSEKKTGSRGSYRCDAKCQQQCPGGVEGWAVGSSNKNCSEATQNAKSATRRGCYPRHCNCKDTEGFIGTGTACENHTR